MYRSAVVFGLYLSFAIAVGAACSNGGGPAIPSDDDSFTPPGANGGTAGMVTGTGGATGGSFATGGTGGSFSTGGTTGGSVGTGGTGGSAGSAGKSAGGTGATGGTTGGTTGVAGHSTGGTGGSTGGTTGGSTGTTGGTGGSTGGTTSGTGGTMAAGGTTGATCDTTWMVTTDGFVRMPAKGGACWSGYAFAGGDKSSMVTFPGGGTDFSKSMGKLEISGMVGSATSANMYAGSVYFGFNVGQTSGSMTAGTVTPTGTSLTVTCTGCATPMMRAQLAGAGGTPTWCATLTSGTAIPYSSFTQECYNATPGAAYAKQPISSIQISIPGTMTAASFDVTLMSVTEQ